MKLLPKLIREVQDTCESMEWEWILDDFYMDLSPSANKKMGLEPGERLVLKGIAFKPHIECEWIRFIFTHKGQLFMPHDISFINKTEDPTWAYQVQLNTFFAGPEMHIIIVDLLRHFSKLYFDDFNVDDDTDYWYTEDKDELLDLFEESGYEEDITGGGMVNDERLMLEEIDDNFKEIFKHLKRLKEQREDDDEGEDWKKLLE